MTPAGPRYSFRAERLALHHVGAAGDVHLLPRAIRGHDRPPRVDVLVGRRLEQVAVFVDDHLAALPVPLG